MSQHHSTLDLVWRYKFYAVFYVLFISFITFTGLYLIGGVPEELRVIDQEQVFSGTVQSTTTDGIVEQLELPERIVIDKIGVNTPVSNPDQSDNETLNGALLKGAVRYPGSGTLGRGNMFIFGHSTGLRVVNNQAFKAFNRVRELNIGDQIRIFSKNMEYNYKVLSVKLVDSNTALVDFSRQETMLTLSTCNVFGQKQDRYVVEALFVKSIPLH